MGFGIASLRPGATLWPASRVISAAVPLEQLEPGPAVSRTAGLRPAGRRLGLLLPALALPGLPRGWKHDERLERGVDRSEQSRAAELDELAVFDDVALREQERALLPAHAGFAADGVGPPAIDGHERVPPQDVGM